MATKLSTTQQKQIIAAAAKKFGIDPAIEWGVYGTETGYGSNVNNSGVGPNGGAKGPFQFEDATARSLGVNPLDFKSAAFGAAKYLSQFKGRGTAGMLSAYNAGPAGGIQQGYVNTVLKDAKSWDGTAPGAVSSPATRLATKVASAGTPTSTTVPDTASYQRALGQYQAGQLQRDGQQTYGPNALAAILPTVAPNQADYVKQVLSQRATSTMPQPEPTHVTSGTTSVGTSGGTVGGVKVGTLPQVHNVSDVLGLKGVVGFDGKPVAAWIGHVLTYARNHGWTGQLTSGYRTDAQQTAIYNSGARPAAVPKSLGGSGSNHEIDTFPGGAADVSNAPQLSQVLAHSPYAHALVWAGSKDPVHFSHPHNGSY